MTDFETHNHNERGWAIAEQWFMRLLAGCLLVIAVVSMIFGAFPDPNGSQLVQTVNIATTLILGIGSIWSFWWSSELDRMYTMIDGFKANGNGRTYAVAVVQLLVGLLFASELLQGQFVLGLLGLMMILSAVFFVWRAQQIAKYS